MKKQISILALLLAFCLLLSTPLGVAAEDAPADFLLGDVNGDNVVNARDALCTLRKAVSKICHFPGQEDTCTDMVHTIDCTMEEIDINGDGNIDAKDALNILRIAVDTYIPA